MIVAAAKWCKDTGRKMWRHRFTYLLLFPGVLYFAVFRYMPMSGLILAFKKFNARLGIWGSASVGLDHFERIFRTPMAMTAIANTLIISFGRLLFEFCVPIFIALMLNEMRGRKLKRVYQTLYTFPHFLSWIVVAALMKNFFNNNGAINSVIEAMGGEKVNFLADTALFRPLLYITGNWKEAGWSAIIYIAAVAGINPELYEAAMMDGASRLQRMLHVTLPGILPTICVMLILAVGNIMNGGFEQIFNLRNGAVSKIANTIDVYVYDITFGATPNYGFSTAVGLFKSVINILMLYVANFSVRKISGQGIFQQGRDKG